MIPRPIATTLGDLTTSELHVVAESVRRGDWNAWDWHLSDADQAVLRHARDVLGMMTTHQERTPDGGMQLLARLVRVPGAAGMARNWPETGSGRVLETQRDTQAEGAFRPVLARVPRSPKAWHPEDDLARAKRRLAVPGGSLGVGVSAGAEGALGASEAVEGGAA